MSFRGKIENNRGIITVIVIVVVGALLLIGWIGTNITAEEQQLKITGLHSKKIPYNEIESVELINNLPTITARTWGYSLAGKKLGNFTTKEYGGVELYLQNSEKPFIFITVTDGKMYLLNTSDPGETNNLYDELMRKLN